MLLVRAKRFHMAVWIKCFIAIIIVCHMNGFVESHNDDGRFHCDSDGDAKIQADYLPGFVTLDGKGDEWDDPNITGYMFPLMPALHPDDHDNKYKKGEMTLKALHDGHSVFFFLQVPGDYRYVKGYAQFETVQPKYFVVTKKLDSVAEIMGITN